MIVLLWLHLTAAVAWIGGMLFLSLVLVPVIRRAGFSGDRRVLFRAVAERFRKVVWTSIFVLLITGPSLLSWRHGAVAASSSWSLVFGVKLGLVALVIGLTAVHDFWIGPRVIREQSAAAAPSEPRSTPLARWSPWIARSALLIGLVILGLGTALVKLS